MGFLKRIFGGGQKETAYRDEHGLYFYVLCDNCGLITRVRADKRHDLNRVDGGHQWHKTIVDNRCYRPIRVMVNLDGNFQVAASEAEGGAFVDEAAFQAQETAVAAEEE